LTVSSGGNAVASINMICTYSAGNFSGTADSNGKVEIIDPTVATAAVWSPARCRPSRGTASIYLCG
jgi:hypothetical protein